MFRTSMRVRRRGTPIITHDRVHDYPLVVVTCNCESNPQFYCERVSSFAFAFNASAPFTEKGSRHVWRVHINYAAWRGRFRYSVLLDSDSRRG